MELVKGANLTPCFLLELRALSALGYWGFSYGESLAAKIALGLGVPLLASVIWGTFVAPKALLVQESAPSRLLLRLSVFGAATTTLYASDHAEMA